MELKEIQERTPRLIQRLVEVWEDSVKATHLFLSPREIAEIKRYVPAALEGVAHLVVAEANHDVEWVRSGPYPYFLKARILGERGHLSNEAGAALACEAVCAGAQTLILAHLSAENNTPQRAYDTVEARLVHMGVQIGKDVVLEVAPRATASRRYAV